MDQQAFMNISTQTSSEVNFAFNLVRVKQNSLLMTSWLSPVRIAAQTDSSEWMRADRQRCVRAALVLSPRLIKY